MLDRSPEQGAGCEHTSAPVPPRTPAPTGAEPRTPRPIPPAAAPRRVPASPRAPAGADEPAPAPGLPSRSQVSFFLVFFRKNSCVPAACRVRESSTIPLRCAPAGSHSRTDGHRPAPGKPLSIFQAKPSAVAMSGQGGTVTSARGLAGCEGPDPLINWGEDCPSQFSAFKSHPKIIES